MPYKRTTRSVKRGNTITRTTQHRSNRGSSYSQSTTNVSGNGNRTTYTTGNNGTFFTRTVDGWVYREKVNKRRKIPVSKPLKTVKADKDIFDYGIQAIGAAIDSRDDEPSGPIASFFLWVVIIFCAIIFGLFILGMRANKEQQREESAKQTKEVIEYFKSHEIPESEPIVVKNPLEVKNVFAAQADELLKKASESE